MKIEIERIANGLLVTVQVSPGPDDPLGMNPPFGTYFAHDGTDLLGRIAEWVEQVYGLDHK